MSEGAVGAGGTTRGGAITTAKGPDTKTRIRTTAAELFRRYGFTGTGLKRIAAESHAPFGSIYHFFPGGKEELVEDTIRTTGPQFQAYVLAVLGSGPDALTALAATFDLAAENLVASDYADACPIATIALEVASTNDRLRQATADVFDDWVEAGTGWFAQWGIAQSDARTLAFMFTSSLEGAFVLSRARRDTQALTAAGRAMVDATRAALVRAGTE